MPEAVYARSTLIWAKTEPNIAPEPI